MSLPKITTPTFEVVVPSTKQQIICRPFLIKEEKILLHASETVKRSESIEQSSKEILGAIRTILQNCILSKIDIKDFAQFDIEYLFLKLRSKSVGEVAELLYKNSDCSSQEPLDIENGFCTQKFSINLNEIEVVSNPQHNKKVMLTEDIGVVMKYPTPEMYMESILKPDEIASSMSLITKCIDQIFDANKVYLTKDYKPEELNEFIESLSSEQMGMILKFFETMPKLEKDIKITCDKCKKELGIHLEGIHDFFA